MNGVPVIRRGRFAGKPINRVPASYLRDLVVKRKPEADVARAELARRGSVIPEMDISPHAINRASTRLYERYQSSRQPARDSDTDPEGLWNWLYRLAHKALRSGTQVDGKIHHKGLVFIFKFDGEWPVLKSVMENRRAKGRREARKTASAQGRANQTPEANSQ